MLSLNRSASCPNCRSQQFYKSRRKAWEHILHRVCSIGLLRCTNCDERYFRFRRAQPSIETNITTPP
jgi:DNA-directed RNA polymerase subunit RPC12/RpoP